MYLDFRRRFLSPLSYKFLEFGSANVRIKDGGWDKMKGSGPVSEMVN
jgi:hypothetical protein